jgi:hypothetical protein
VVLRLLTVKQQAENQIIIDYEVYARRPNDSDLLSPLSRRIKPC